MRGAFMFARKLREVMPERPRFVLLALPIALVISFPARAQQHEHAASSGASAVCTAKGFGRIHHPVKTENPQAQRLFEQAMALDYGFNHSQAEQCFRRAAPIEPQKGLPDWGIALV